MGGPVKKFMTRRRGLFDFCDMRLTVASKMLCLQCLRRKPQNHMWGMSPKECTLLWSNFGSELKAWSSASLAFWPRFDLVKLDEDAPSSTRTSTAVICEGIACKWRMMLANCSALLWVMRASTLSNFGVLPTSTDKRQRISGERALRMRSRSPPTDEAASSKNSSAIVATHERSEDEKGGKLEMRTPRKCRATNPCGE